MMQPTPLRPAEQVVGGFISMSLGGQNFNVKVLPMGANRKWTADLATEIRAKLGSVGAIETADQVAHLLADQAETMMDLLIAYDVMGDKVLPDREWIDTNATDTECYEAMKRVTAAAYPFGPDLLRIVPEIVPMLMDSISRGVAGAAMSMALSPSMSGLRRTTAGPLPSSKPASPTSSSPSMPKRARRAVGKKPGQSRNASSTA